MSVRLVTTPWFTKNFAGGWLDTRRLLGAEGDGRRDGTARGCRGDPNRRRASGRPGLAAGAAAYHRGHAPRPRHRQHERHARPVPGGRAAWRPAARRPTPRATADELELLLDGLLRLDGIVARRRRRRRAGLRRPGADRRAGGHRRAATSAPLLVGRRRARSRSPSASTGPARSAPTGWSTRWPPPGCTGRRPSWSTSAPRPRSTASPRDGAYVGGAIAPGPRPRARGARGADRQAAPDRAARPGPGDRAGHGQRDPVRRRPRPPGARGGPARRASGASWPTPTGSRPAAVRAILTGGLSAAPWADVLDGIDAIDPDLTLKGLAILHAEVGGGEPLELGLA